MGWGVVQCDTIYGMGWGVVQCDTIYELVGVGYSVIPYMNGLWDGLECGTV